MIKTVIEYFKKNKGQALLEIVTVASIFALFYIAMWLFAILDGTV